MSAPTALALSTDAEKAAVLSELVNDDRQLARRAEHAPLSRLGHVDPNEVAITVADALLAIDQEELSAHAGRTKYGYVAPTEAAWWLLERAVEPWLEDITRRAALGLSEGASRLVLGVLEVCIASATAPVKTVCCSRGRPTAPARPLIASSGYSATPASS